MARKEDKEIFKHKATMNRKNTKLSDFINSNLSKLYSNTYYSNLSDKEDLNNIKNKLDDSIDNLVTVNKDNSGRSSLSTLYSRLSKTTDIPEEQNITHSLEDLMNDNAVMDASMMSFINSTSTSIFDYDNKIDTILKYMPELKEALDCRKDNVLSADHFSKDFINVINKNLSENSKYYNEHIKEIKKRYKFTELADQIYDLAATYGECFVYCVPTKKAIARLLKNKSNTSDIINGVNIKESCNVEDIKNLGIEQKEFDQTSDIKVECNKIGMIESVVNSQYKYNKVMNFINEMSLNENSYNEYECYFTEVCEIMTEDKKNDQELAKFDKEISKDRLMTQNKLNLDKFEVSQDGLIDRSKSKNKKHDGTKIEIPGSIIKILDRKNVIPLYIEDHCLGYYYIETEGTFDNIDINKMQDPVMSLKGTKNIANGNADLEENDKQNRILKFISSQISKFVDANFVNNNQDIRDEIYMILKYNEKHNMNKINKIKVTFIPPDDIEHVYFDKDPNTHRGKSDLNRALFPATLYSSMYITSCLWTMTRSQDKRVYYVKQSVDTNISKTLLETINQIKKGNMNIRQIENINHILNITGQFNDYVIPKSSSGETPIDFDIMQGQSINYQTELMNTLKEMSINSTDVPIEMIQMRQSVDYATQLSMSSSKFLRKVYNRQSKYQVPLTSLFNKLYANEYNDNVTLEVKLPPPMFLNITNTNQMINNVRDYSQSIADIMLDITDDDNIKQAVIRKINKLNLGSYLDIDRIEEVINEAVQEAAAENNPESEEV